MSDAKAGTITIKVLPDGLCHMSATRSDGSFDSDYVSASDAKTLARDLPQLIAELRAQSSACGSSATE